MWKNKEKRGGSKKGEGSSRSFVNFVDKVGAIDLGFSRSQFTWSNRRVGLANIRERLDRGICNANWQCLFPKAGVRHLVAVRNFREIKGEQKALRHDKSLSLRLDLSPLLRDY